MGIKHFFMWYKNNMGHNMLSLEKNAKLRVKGVSIDNLLLDLNGIFHNSAQKIFKYGSHAPPKRFLLSKTSVKVNGVENNRQNRIRCYQDICQSIENLVTVVDPHLRLIMCVDGPAPLGKQNQQRQRRFRAANESNLGRPFIDFDSNCITPGTEFMHELGEYIDEYIKRRNVESIKWKSMQVIFSNEKVPGEGEHKAVEFVREHGTDDETYCINGPDADLFMLALATHKPNFYILREDMYNPANEFFCVDILKTRKDLLAKLLWSSPQYTFNETQAINDFIFMCFTVGNDFLPHVPSIEIIEDGVELMIDIYRSVGEVGGHLTKIDKKGRVTFDKDVLTLFFVTIGNYEKENFERKLGKQKSFFPDPIMMKHSHKDERKWHLDVAKFTDDYNAKHFNASEEEEKMKYVCHQYLQGLQWVITYYTTGCPSWKWYYPYQYAPMAKTLASHLSSYKQPRYGVTIPSLPFQQLLSVLPPKSAHLIPKPLDELLTNPKSKMRKFCPEKLVIDLSGKRKEWEGITLLPMVDQALVTRMCKKHVGFVSDVDKVRNVSEVQKVY